MERLHTLGCAPVRSAQLLLVPEHANATRTPRNRTLMRAAWQCIQEFRSGAIRPRDGRRTKNSAQLVTNSLRVWHEARFSIRRGTAFSTGDGVRDLGRTRWLLHIFRPPFYAHRCRAPKVAARGADSTVQAGRRSAVNCPVPGMRIGMKAGQHARTYGRFGISGSPLSLRWSLTRCVPVEQWQPW